MTVYLVRHGRAQPKEEGPQRELTPAGREEVARVAEFLRPLGLRVAAIWHSGKPRALQTAEMMAGTVTAEAGLVQREDLFPEADVMPLAGKLDKAAEDLMIVGHLPHLSNLASMLLGVEDEVIDFAKAAVLCLRRGDETWQVAWMIAPELLAPRAGQLASSQLSSGQ